MSATPPAPKDGDSTGAAVEEPIQMVELIGDPSVGVCTDGYCVAPGDAGSAGAADPSDEIPG